jgi:hypothetical protein
VKINQKHFYRNSNSNYLKYNPHSESTEQKPAGLAGFDKASHERGHRHHHKARLVWASANLGCERYSFDIHGNNIVFKFFNL